MDIQFPGPTVPANDGGISFKALVDGQVVACKFSMEALQDVNPEFAAASPEDQFQASKSRLLAIAETKIRAGKVSNGCVQVFTNDL